MANADCALLDKANIAPLLDRAALAI